MFEMTINVGALFPATILPWVAMGNDVFQPGMHSNRTELAVATLR
jgi:hypothetical protein